MPLHMTEMPLRTPEDAAKTSAERVAHNDAAFREANERIQAVARAHDTEREDLIPMLCECADLSCTDILLLAPQEYEAVRRDPTHFINAHGHHQSAGPWARVVEEYERYAVVEKLGQAAEIVTDLDPRGGDAA